MLAGDIGAAPVQALGFDCDTVLTKSQAAEFSGQEFDFVIRYLPRDSVITPTSSQGCLTAAEAEDILTGGLALMAVQHVASPPWTPSAALGQTYGTYAVLNAEAVGLPAGINIWLDLEGVASGVEAQIIADYCSAWYDVVSTAGFVPGLYVGANCGLTADQLAALPFRYFWQSGSTTPTPTGVGYCMSQSISSSYVLDGVSYDLDTVFADQSQKTPLWLAPL